MKSKARKLLILLVGAASVALSATGGCYVIDSFKPQLPVNSPPSVNFERVEPPYYGIIDINKDEKEFQSFDLPEIWDPDPEERLYGIYAIDYFGVGTPTQKQFAITRSDEETTRSGTVWKAEFQIRVADDFTETRCYEVMVVISDREFETAENPFGVPEDTMAVRLRWLFRVYDNQTPPAAIQCEGRTFME